MNAAEFLPAPEPKRGVMFLHRRIIYPDTKTPAKMIVTAVRTGRVYYRFFGGGGNEFATFERWPQIAAALPKNENPDPSTR